LDLMRGHLRAEAAGMTKPGASLEVRTADAIVSGAGATFLVSTVGRGTQACAMIGSITVRRLNIPGFVRVSENQCTRVPPGGGPAPAQESVRTMQTGIYLTTVVGSLVAAPLEGHPSWRSIGAAAGAGAAAGLDAGAFFLMGNARRNLARAR